MDKSDFEPDNNSVIHAVASAYISYGQFKQKAKDTKHMLVVDYTQPSYKKRMFLIDIASGEIVRKHHVAHGDMSSDPRNKARAIYFSNTVDSHKSSIGAMVTGIVYVGKHGRSCRLLGLEKGVNDNVYRRAIVVHASNYVTDDYILRTGRAGCSWGCLACDPAISNSLIDDIRDGTFVYCYGG